MAKPKSPLLSLGARGTIGDALTYQKRGQDTIVREKPIPRDPYSLNQAYQRWDYRDYAYLWTLLTNSEKQVYRTKASRYHITGFSQFMREKLKDLPDLLGRWHLDERSGALVYDSSRNSHNGIIFGATPVDGAIDGAYFFDGINDIINFGTHSEHDITSPFTVEFFLTWKGKVGWQAILSKGQNAAWILNNYMIGFLSTDPPRLRFTGTFRVAANHNSIAALLKDRRYHIAAVYDGTNSIIYIDGQLDSQLGGTQTPTIIAQPLTAGSEGTYFGNVTLDEIRLYNRARDITEIRRHSERRYPA